MAYTSNTQGNSYRHDGIVYFAGDSSSESWAGVIGDDYDMTDDQVNDYIKTTKPELFDKLHGMRFSSSDIPLSFKPMRDLRRLEDMDTENRSRNQSGYQGTISRYASAISEKLRPSIERARGSTSNFAQPPRNVDQRQVLLESHQEHNQDQLKLDGVAQRDILSAAERLYPKIGPAKTAPLSFRDRNTEPDPAFKYLPNSKQALDRRALKQLEINETLAEVSKYEKALKNAKSQLRQLELRSPSPDASVLITRPVYMEPRDDRYKKQGLTAYDREKYTKALRRTEASSHSAPVKDFSGKLLFCYCREPDNGREMVRCSRDWCPVGWFHLDCTGLDRLPFLNEEFHCCYCSDDLGPLVSDELLDRRPYCGNELAGKIVESVAQQYLDNEIETDIVFKEHDGGHLRTHAPGRISIYDDESDEDGTGIGSDVTDDSWAAEECARLHAKIVKWRAVNDPYQRSNMPGGDIYPTDDRKSTTSSTTSFFDDDSDDSQNSADEEDLASDDATIRASSPIAAMTESNTNFNDKENNTEHFYENDNAGLTDSEMTAIDSADKSDDGELSDLMYYGRDKIDAMPLSFNSQSTAATQLIYPLQPSTMTDSYNTKHNGSFLTSLNDLQTHFSSFYNPVIEPRTPTLAPQVSPGRSKKPWGTPVNIKDYNMDFNYDLVAEPPSPSPAKRKFDQFENDFAGETQDMHGDQDDCDEDEEEQQEETNDGDDEYEYEDDVDVKEDSDNEEGEMVPFMLDLQEP